MMRRTEPREHDWMFGNDTDDPLRHAFDRKLTIHPGIRGEMATPVEWTAILENRMRAEGSRGKRAVYISIPFCRRRCRYCNFYKYPADRMAIARYVDCLVKEIEMAAGSPFVRSRPFNAVYIGGGTPTELTADDITRIMRALKDAVPLANDCEITFETRTNGFDEDMASACLEAGVNRFSVGVQSFSTEVRQKLGRMDDRDALLKKLAWMRDDLEAAVIIDLMFGLPGQSMEVWEDDLRTWLDLDLDGGDLYQLIVLKGSDLDREQASAGDRPATVVQQAEMFERAVEIMRHTGYRRLSVSHWGNGNRERSMYNSLVASGQAVLPFGPAAGGSFAGVSLMVKSDLAAYEKGINDGIKPLEFLMYHHPWKDLFSDIAGQMNAGRLDLNGLVRRYGVDLRAEMGPLLDRWIGMGLMERHGSILELTTAGQFWMVNLAQGILDQYVSRDRGLLSGLSNARGEVSSA